MLLKCFALGPILHTSSAIPAFPASNARARVGIGSACTSVHTNCGKQCAQDQHRINKWLIINNKALPARFYGSGQAVLPSSPHFLWIRLCSTTSSRGQVLDFKQITPCCQQIRRRQSARAAAQKALVAGVLLCHKLSAPLQSRCHAE